MSEGVIKFNIEKWIKTNQLDIFLYDKIEKSRDVLYNLKLVGFDETTKLGYGNVSSRYKDDEFIITGSQTGNIDHLNGNHYCIIKKVDFDKNSVICEGPIQPSSESITHASCYYSNKNINSVIHIHNKILWNKLLDLNYPSTPESAEYGSIQLSKEIIKSAGLYDNTKPQILVMKGHQDGIIGYGNDLDKILKTITDLYNEYVL